MQDLIWQDSHEKLQQIAKAFYQAYRLSGTVKMKFGLRTIPDSDGNSVVDVYVSPRDQESASTLLTEDNARHMQFLENMVPSTVLGYQFILQMTPAGTNDVDVEVRETIEPIAQSNPASSGPGLAS